MSNKDGNDSCESTYDSCESGGNSDDSLSSTVSSPGGRGRDVLGRGRGRGRGRGQGRGKCSDYGTQHGKSKPSKGKTPLKKFQVPDLLDVDNDVPKTHDFKPLRAAGACLPSGYSVEPSPTDLFQLFFDNEIVQKICNATNEYAERQKTKRPTMHCYFKNMFPDDFYALMGYRRIPQYRLMWKPSSLCYDPLISKVFSRITCSR